MKKINLIRPGFFGKHVPSDERRIEFDILNEQILYLERYPDYVFLGDSITDRWDIYAYIKTDKFIVNRAVSGEHSEFLLKRFDADCVQLKPEYAVILIGTNDIFRTHPDEMGIRESEDEVFINWKNNINEMVSKCENADIKPVLCSVIPSDVRLPFDKEIRWRLTEKMNDYLKTMGKIYIDYHSKLTEDGKSISKKYSHDGIHANAHGYEVMAKILIENLQF